MKKLALLVAFGLIAGLAIAQKLSQKDVPQAVKASFEKAFPKASEVKWNKEGSNYEASFDFNKSDYSVLFDAQGRIIETEVEIEPEQLPKAVKDFLSANYSGKEIKEAAKITDAKGTVTYEAQIGKKDLIFDSQGNFLKIKEK